MLEKYLLYLLLLKINENANRDKYSISLKELASSYELIKKEDLRKAVEKLQSSAYEVNNPLNFIKSVVYLEDKERIDVELWKPAHLGTNNVLEPCHI